MSNPHSSVNYVEPNLSMSTSMNGGLEYEKTPDLEDYSIYFNIEVEVCSRKNISNGNTITKNVIIMEYKSPKDGGKDTVNFMGGTKIETDEDNGGSVNYLTTNYGDMYVNDLVNYGTTEMIGVKSINIEYQKACIPRINIKFTDVRGLSLFQPTELNRSNSYLGTGGISADNIAQSFFQCFFMVPPPRFTMTIKGFYGKPVTYEVLCDKFETSFNSETGDFDIDTSFIGYTYSFMTDIVMDALLAAPYSDYGGLDGTLNKYWKQQVDNGRFTIPNKEKTKLDAMPTLYEMYNSIKNLTSRKDGDETSISEEEKNHAVEINSLVSLKSMYASWYTTLFNICSNRFGKDYCYLFGDNEQYNMLLILTNEKLDSSKGDLSGDYRLFSDDFKRLNENLNASVDEFNKKNNSFSKLKRTSDDFSDYKLTQLFNNITLTNDGRLTFNGFSSKNYLPRNEVFRKIFGENGNGDESALRLIYNDGESQYVNCYVINVEYDLLESRLKALQADANRSVSEKEAEKRRKAINDEMLRKLKWYPSVENFSKIMIAHLETFMNQMYDCVNKCEGRKASDLKVNPSENLDMPNNNKDTIIPPFPRIYRSKIGDDHLVTNEDVWAGEFSDGIGFEEVNLVNGLLNGASKVRSEFQEDEVIRAESSRMIQSSDNGTFITHPITSFDLYINQPIYDFGGDISSDGNQLAFAGKIGIRMFNVFGLNNFRNELSNFYDESFAYKLGRIDGQNFIDSTRMLNKELRSAICGDVFNKDFIFSAITSKNKNAPWGNEYLFKTQNGLFLNRYKVGKKGESDNYIFPIQNISFKELSNSYSCMQGDNITNSNGDIALLTIPTTFNDKSANDNDSFGYGTTLILENVSEIENRIKSSNSDYNEDYNELHNEILSSVANNELMSYDFYTNLDGAVSVSNMITLDDKTSIKHVTATSSNTAIITVSNGEKERQVKCNVQEHNKLTISEIFGCIKNGRNFIIDRTSSMFAYSGNFLTGDDYKIGGYALNEDMAYLTIALMGVRLNYNKVYEVLNSGKTVMYLPRVAVLQIGAIIYTNFGIHGYDGKKIYERLPIDNDAIIIGTDYINNLNKTAKHAFEKYYIDWINNHLDYVKELKNESHYLTNSVDTNRGVFNQNDEFVINLSNELISNVCVVKLNNAQKKNDVSAYTVSNGIALNYFDGFVSKLKEVYMTDEESSKGSQVTKTTKEPTRTNDAIKIELYRYLKQIYDKWIPMSSLDNWSLESFFNDKNGEKIGHKFYFIDSYYNDIGHKLLLNPKTISEKIGAFLSTTDIGRMMLGFMSDMYSANKAMLMTIQNFYDLKKPNSMDEMFTPIPYTDSRMNEINKYPSFVVVYPYQPSRNLDVDNSEFKNDGFMLNDEFDTPLPIRTKVNESEGHYRIPAFGVSYGKQYQSYFKRVNVNMNSPIATEQAIRMKHSIILGSQSNGEIGIKTQDMYDIYSNNSYTCTVEMMGCAWIQPLMYFVLLNVPMFRGSYLVLSVKHSIKPGDMTTTFTGCRMGNVSTTLVDEMFTDDALDSTSSVSSSTNVPRAASANEDIDNDCEYKTYPLNNDTKELSEKTIDSGITMMEYLIENNGFLPHAAAGVIGNAIKESGLDSMVVSGDSNGYFSAGLFQWNEKYGNITKLCTNNVSKYGGNDTTTMFSTSKEGVAQIKAKLPAWDKQLDFMVATLNKVLSELGEKTSVDDLNKLKSPNEAAIKFARCYEKPSDAEYLGRDTNAEQLYEKYLEKHNSGNVSIGVYKSDEDKLYKNFSIAIRKSVLNNPSIGVVIITERNEDGMLVIKQKDVKKNKSKMNKVFDLILNSEYYDYVEKLKVIYPNGGLSVQNVNPSEIKCSLKRNVAVNEKRVELLEGKDDRFKQKTPFGNDEVMKILAKRRSKLNNESLLKEIPQISKLEDLDNMCEDCGSLKTTNGFVGSLTGYSGKLTDIKKVKENKDLYTLIDVEHIDNDEEWALNYINDENYAMAYMKKNGTKPPYKDGKGYRIYKNKSYHLCPSGPTSWYKRIGINLVWWSNGNVTKSSANSTYEITSGNFTSKGFKLVWHGTFKEVMELGKNKNSFCPGDIATFHVEASNGPTSHAVMWTGKDWRSDYIQENMGLQTYGDKTKDRQGNHSVCIWRHEKLIKDGLGLDVNGVT